MDFFLFFLEKNKDVMYCLFVSVQLKLQRLEDLHIIFRVCLPVNRLKFSYPSITCLGVFRSLDFIFIQLLLLLFRLLMLPVC